MIVILDYAITLIILAVTLPLLTVKVILLAISTRISYKPYEKKAKKILRIVQGDFETIQKKGVFFIVLEDKNFFEHVYVVTFPSDRSSVIKHGSGCTFIEIGRIGIFLKQMGLNLTYACINFFWFFWQITGLCRLARNEISLIRGSDPHHTGIAAMLLGFLAKVPYCISIHSDYDLIFPDGDTFYRSGLHIPARLLRKMTERFVFSHTKHILAISSFISDYALRNGARPQNIKRIPHCVDAKIFEDNGSELIRDKFSWQGKKLIVTVSRISREKNIFDIPDIAKELGIVSGVLTFIIVGDGPDKEEFVRKIKTLGLEQEIQLIGFQQHDTVVAIRKTADINLCLFDGYSLIEAALSARPVVAYNTEWHAELIKDGVTGILVPDRDIKAAVSAIKRLLDNPDFANHLGRQAKELAMLNHSFEGVRNIKKEIYEQIL